MTGKRHVFLFRHCLRSVSETIDFHDGSDGNNAGAAYSANPFDYLPEWPSWNTPPEWCTDTGFDIVKGTGAFLLKRYLVDDGGDQETKRVAFVSDNSPRDIQTALAMISGMAEEIQKQTQNDMTSPYYRLQGLDNIDIDPPLFHPFERNGFRSQFFQRNEVCMTPPKEDTTHSIEQRLRTILPPDSLSNIMKWMETLTGRVDLFQSFTYNDPNHAISLAPDGKHFIGAWNLVKYVAQSIVYSRASGIDYWKNVTPGDMYNLMAWEHWSRNIQNVGNNVAAAGGGVLMARILQALNVDHPNDVTFIIGHDGDLDAVATALNMSWTLPSPYHSAYTPTPPGCGLHFSYDDSDEIEISFLAPIYFSDRSLNPNTSGILVEVPVEFGSFETNGRGGTATIVPSLDALRDRTLSTLRKYSGSMECFEAAEEMWSLDQIPSKAAPDHAGSIALLVGGLLVFAIAMLFQCLRRQSPHTNVTKRHRATKQFTGMPDLEDLELT